MRTQLNMIDHRTGLSLFFAANANLDAFKSAVFTVKAGTYLAFCYSIYCSVRPKLGANKLTRPVAGGTVSAGILKAHPSTLPSGVSEAPAPSGL